MEQNNRRGYFNLIISGGGSGCDNMDYDSHLLDRYKVTDDFTSRPTLRLYYFSPPALSLGFFQKDKDIDRHIILKARKNGYDIVRRPTGGRAVLHKDEITYSVVSSYKSGIFAGKLIETYKKISKFLNAFFAGMGLNPDNSDRTAYSESDIKSSKLNLHRESLHESLAETTSESLKLRRHAPQDFNCFLKAHSYEITFNGKKICGNAQRRNEMAFLQHGSIYIDYNPLEHIDLFEGSSLNNDNDNIEYFNNITGIKNELDAEGLSFDLGFNSLSEVLAQSFQEAYNLNPFLP